MKKKNFILILTIVSIYISTGVFAQDISDKEKQREEEIKKLDEMRKKTITLHTNLRDEQAPEFWVIYEKYSLEKRKVNRKLSTLRIIGRTQSDAELKKNFEDRFLLREEEVGLERKYFNEFLTVLSIRQIVEFYQIEKYLKRKIMKYFKNKFKEKRKIKRKEVNDFDEY